MWSGRSGVRSRRGCTSEDAALAVGASQAAGSRWFRERGGMPTFMTRPGHRPVSVVPGAGGDRCAEGPGRRGAGDRPPAGPRSLDDLAGAASQRRDARWASWTTGRRSRSGRPSCWRRRPKTAKLVENERLREYVQERLSGQVRRPDGTPVERAGDGAVEGPEQAASSRPALGDGVEPGADLEPADARLPR